jgi:HPr kinase/phosphorylase
MVRIHASSVVIKDKVVLLRGPSGSGKSDLALRLIDQGATLLSDDYVALCEEDGIIIARPPKTIAGLIEVRGLGILRIPYCEQGAVHLVADLVPPDDVPRLPKKQMVELSEFQGISVRHIQIAPFEESATAKIAFALSVPSANILNPEQTT